MHCVLRAIALSAGLAALAARVSYAVRGAHLCAWWVLAHAALAERVALGALVALASLLCMMHTRRTQCSARPLCFPRPRRGFARGARQGGCARCIAGACVPTVCGVRAAHAVLHEYVAFARSYSKPRVAEFISRGIIISDIVITRRPIGVAYRLDWPIGHDYGL
jgi:hypothetical protein